MELIKLDVSQIQRLLNARPLMNIYFLCQPVAKLLQSRQRMLRGGQEEAEEEARKAAPEKANKAAPDEAKSRPPPQQPSVIG